jgi:glycosyltransferase involved in cell wall biosynthesis
LPELKKLSKIQNSIVIPAYNEELGLPYVLKDIAKIIDSSYEVTVVDDGSSDNTSSIKSTFPFKMIVFKKNKGKGAALIRGFQESKGENIIWLDADGAYPVEKIPEIINLLNKGFDLVYSKRGDRHNISLISRIGIKFLQLILKIFKAIDVSEPFSGLCAIKSRHINSMNLESKKWAIELEIAIKAKRMGLKTKEILIPYKKRIGSSKLNQFVAGFQMLIALAKFYNWKPKNI